MVIERSPAPMVADERTLGILDFPAILARLADRCACALGRELAVALRPSARRRQIETDQAETAEARALLDAGRSLPLSGLHDVREPLRRAARGARLPAAELWAIGEAAAAIGRLRGFFA